MAIVNKNEVDGPPVFNVDLTPTAPAGQPLNGTRWYQAEWTTDQSLFANAGGRTPLNFWTEGTFESQVRNFRVGLPGAQWDLFKAGHRHLYFRVGAGTLQDMATWLWSEISDIVINHMPQARAGASRSVPLASDGSVPSAVVLDSAGSSDPDPGSTLSYAWRLKTPPASCFDLVFLEQIRTAIAGDHAQVTPFPAGSAIPLPDEGTYVFELEVTDDDPPSFNKNTVGRATAEVRITLGTCIRRIVIDSPTSAAPARRIRPAAIDVEIAWRMDPALHQQLQASYSGRHYLRLFIESALAPPGTTPTYTDLQLPVPESGLFIWSGQTTLGLPAPPGTYDIRLALLDNLDQPVSVPDYLTEALERGAIVLDAFSARIDRASSPTFVPFGSVAGVLYEVMAPEPLDEVNLVIQGLLGTSRISLGSLSGAATFMPPAPGQYVCVIEAKRGGLVVAVSQPHETWVMDDPLAPVIPAFPVGQATYDSATDPLAPADTRTLTLPAGDGYAGAVSVPIHALVRYPAAAAGPGTAVNTSRAKWPLVLIVHGNHTQLPPATGSYTGFDYLATHLAAQGFIAASLEMEALNGTPPPGSIHYRGRAINAHLNRWLWKATNDPLFAGRVDMGRVGLIGHSRGGDAVVEAVVAGPPAGAAIGAVASIAPTDFLGNVLTGRPYFVLYGSVDGDVAVADGFKLYDRADRPRAQVFLYGATHNDFCDHADWHTERSEPAPSRMLLRPTVQAAAKAFLAAFLHWALNGRTENQFFFDAQNTPPALRALAPGMVTVKSLELAPTLVVDRFLAPPITISDVGTAVSDDPPGALSPFNEQSLRLTVTGSGLSYATPFFQQDTDGGYLGWGGPSGYVVAIGNRDVSGFRVLTFRLAQALGLFSPPADPRNPVGIPKNLRVTLVDIAGATATVDLASFGQAAPYPYVRNDQPIVPYSAFDTSVAEGVTKSAFTNVRLPLWAFTTVAPSLDLTHVATLRLELDGTGLVAVDDFEFSP